MKKYISLLILLFISTYMVAQIRTVSTNIYGNYNVTLKVIDQGYVTLNSYGEILDIDMDGDISYYSDFNDYESGKVKKIGSIEFTYYSDFNNYEAGKIKKIGNISFTYYSNFNNYETGKIKKIGNTDFSYYSDFNDYEVGKIKKIGNINFTYYSGLNDYEKGKVKTIGSNSYTYFSDRENKKMTGKVKSGKSNFEEGGIRFRVRR